MNFAHKKVDKLIFHLTYEIWHLSTTGDLRRSALRRVEIVHFLGHFSQFNLSRRVGSLSLHAPKKSHDTGIMARFANWSRACTT
jgi:hypothetical protein